ncbi:hypothetical protein Vse01_55480 [Micromonospora sediminimaris]|uniref:Uncharacterized protein n=1 Tax=Micromonospora sediminimaris TaxID=547162 RepID=A0A9W5UXC0_9ACTN|nr:hypothetical protein Vse01_55480 [Micromonospora sediminimaris]
MGGAGGAQARRGGQQVAGALGEQQYGDEPEGPVEAGQRGHGTSVYPALPGLDETPPQTADEPAYGRGGSVGAGTFPTAHCLAVKARARFVERCGAATDAHARNLR